MLMTVCFIQLSVVILTIYFTPAGLYVIFSFLNGCYINWQMLYASYQLYVNVQYVHNRITNEHNYKEVAISWNYNKINIMKNDYSYVYA